MVSNTKIIQYADYHEDSQEMEICSAESKLLFVHKMAHLLALPNLQFYASTTTNSDR
jgi:hypothetical protein